VTDSAAHPLSGSGNNNDFSFGSGHNAS